MRPSLWSAARFSSCWVLLGANLAACGGSDDEPQPVPRPGSREAVEAAIVAATSSGAGEARFATHVKPVLADKCVYCHHTLNATGLDLTRPFDPERGVVGRQVSRPRSEARLLVDPGNPRNSFILDKVIRENLVYELEGNAMPWQIPMLGVDSVSAIRSWIGAGALDDEAYRAEVAPIFAANCIHCHNPNSGQEPDLTEPFDPVVGVVGVAAGNGVRVVPGDPGQSLLVLDVEGATTGGVPMPFHPERLTEAEVAALIRWIAAGALND